MSESKQSAGVKLDCPVCLEPESNPAIADQLRGEIQGCVTQASQLVAHLHREVEAAIKAVAGFSSSEH